MAHRPGCLCPCVCGLAWSRPALGASWGGLTIAKVAEHMGAQKAAGVCQQAARLADMRKVVVAGADIVQGEGGHPARFFFNHR